MISCPARGRASRRWEGVCSGWSWTWRIAPLDTGAGVRGQRVAKGDLAIYYVLGELSRCTICVWRSSAAAQRKEFDSLFDECTQPPQHACVDVI